MGIKPATNNFQSRMVSIFQSMRQHKPHPYITNTLHEMGENFDKHLHILNEIFEHLSKDRKKVNLDKSKLCTKMVEFLGSPLRQTSHQWTHEWIKAILKIAHSHKNKKVHGFLGAINFIKNHSPNCADVWQSIPKFTKKDIPFIWEEKQAAASNKSSCCLQCYPPHLPWSNHMLHHLSGHISDICNGINASPGSQQCQISLQHSLKNSITPNSSTQLESRNY